jgi:short subunit dehydrogenase-like uncharacterized protein
MLSQVQRSILFLGRRGYTGNLIHKKISGLARVLAPELSRDRSLQGQLEDLKQHLRPGDLVLNCLGPFGDSYAAVSRLCMQTGTHYLDICAEWQVFEALRELDQPAKDAGSMLLPGIGFDVVASDCLAAHVVARLPNTTKLQIGISGLELLSRGSARTMSDLIGQAVRIRRQGKIVSNPGMREQSFDFGQGEQSALAVSWGDISSAYHSTGVPNIEVFFEATPALMAAAFANRTFGWMFSNTLVDRTAQGVLSRLPAGPSTAMRKTRRVTLVARAEDEENNRVESRMVTQEAYSFTAQSVCDIAIRLCEGECPPGFQTPAGLFGADYVLSIEGSKRQDIRSQAGGEMLNGS